MQVIILVGHPFSTNCYRIDHRLHGAFELRLTQDKHELLHAVSG
jgi:hypothetical protein